MRKKAFTLIELLVVIAIIAILAAILFPVFARAKESAKKAAGLAQMKQLAIAVQMYAADYDDGLPSWQECLADLQWNSNPDACNDGTFWEPQHFWDAKLQPYVKNGNPANDEHNGIWESPGKETYEGRSIGMNQLVFWDISSWVSGGVCQHGASTYRYSGCYFWLKQSGVVEPASTMFSADTGTSGRYEPVYFLNGYAERFVTTYGGYGLHEWGQPWRYNEDGANYTWLDGHAKHHKGDQIYPNPDHADTLSFGTPISISLYCSAYNNQAATDGMKNVLNLYIVNTLGGFCN